MDYKKSSSSQSTRQLSPATLSPFTKQSESQIFEDPKLQGPQDFLPDLPSSPEEVERERKRNQVVLVMIALAQGFTTFASLSINFFFKDDLELDPAQLSFFNSIINFVWILKPVFGFICDSYPIFGSQRKAYLFIFSGLQTVCWVWLGLNVDNLGQAILVKSLINVSAAFVDVIGEALMVQASQVKQEDLIEEILEEGRENNELRPEVQYDTKSTATNISIFLSLISLSSLLSQYLGGHLLNFISSRQIFLITAIFPVITFISGFIVVEATDPDPHTSRSIKREQKCQLAMKNLAKVASLLKLPFIYRPIIFIFLVVLSPGVTDAMFYYQSNVLAFSATQFASINVFSSVAVIVGVWTYRFLFKDTPFKAMMVGTTLLFALAQISKLLIVLPNGADVVWCEQYLNLSPVHYYYITSWLYSFINQLHLMPLMVLACKMCPKKVEASFYAMVMAIINLGYLTSYQLGGILTFALGITSESFSTLWILILIASVVPLVTLFFLLVLPASVDVNEQIEEYLREKQERFFKNGGTKCPFQKQKGDEEDDKLYEYLLEEKGKL